MRPVQQLCDLFHEQGLKVTPQRRQIFEALQDDIDHPAAEDVFQRVQDVMPDISLATVYHTLNHLVEMGEILELDLGEGKSRYDLSTEDHHHLVCLGCRRIVDIEHHFDGLGLSPEESSGYEIVRREVVFYGYCPECQG
jgi:Fe2+ or Zn2+ uptake regulation protein